jgi:regulation of enolase protein 1 (concanavalin A-like superfamily)
MRETFDWKVVLYDENDEVIRTFTIKDRTEHEAENEAQSEVNNSSVSDWSMSKILPKKKK